MRAKRLPLAGPLWPGKADGSVADRRYILEPTGGANRKLRAHPKRRVVKMLRPARGASLNMVLLSGAWVFSGIAGYAQTGQGTLTGSVTDSSGALISGVSVAVRNQDTGFLYNAVTTQEG